MNTLFALLMVINLNGTPIMSIQDTNLTAEDCFPQESIALLDQNNTQFIALACKEMDSIAPAPLPPPTR